MLLLPYATRLCVVRSPPFRFCDHVERTTLDDEQPRKMLLKRDPDSYEVCACMRALHSLNILALVA